MKNAIEALGSAAVAMEGGHEVRPASARDLLNAINTLRDLRRPFSDTLRFSRALLNGLGAVNPQRGTIDVGAGVALQSVETLLNAQGLTLGALPRSGLEATVAAFCEGPCAGQRLRRGGLTEPLLAHCELVTAAGQLLTVAEPAGIDLTALLRQRRPRVALLTTASLQILPLPEHEATLTFTFGSANQLTSALRDMLEDQVMLVSVEVQAMGGHTRGCRVLLQGSRTALARDRSSVWAAVRRAEGREASFESPPTAGEGRRCDWSVATAAVSSLGEGQSLLMELPTRLGVLLTAPHMTFSALPPQAVDLSALFDPQHILEAL